MFLGKKVFSTSTAIALAAAIAMFAWSGMAAAESEEAGVELQTYFSNANVTAAGNAYVNVVAPFEGNATSATGSVANGETCAMMYVFDTSQAMEECCGCPISADGLLSFSITNQLAQQPVGDSTAGVNSLENGSIRILSTKATFTPITWLGGGDVIPSYVGCDFANSVCYDPTGDYNGDGTGSLAAASELVAWAQHIQNTQITEGEFEVAPFSESDFDELPTTCGSLVTEGSGAGVCICPTESITS